MAKSLTVSELASSGMRQSKAGQAGQGAGALLPLFATTTRTPPRSLAPVSAARQRKLHIGHFACMRSVVQGLDPRASWERYFSIEGEATDQRTVRTTIAWIREEFAVAAKRHDRFGTAWTSASPDAPRVNFSPPNGLCPHHAA